MFGIGKRNGDLSPGADLAEAREDVRAVTAIM